MQASMPLRRELMPPVLDEALVSPLSALAAAIDGGDPSGSQTLVMDFNRQAGTEYGFDDFQGIYGAEAHETWVRRVLAQPFAMRVADITRGELVEMARRVIESDGPEHAIGFWLEMLEINIPDEHISDLIFWPQDYLGYDPGDEGLTAGQVIDMALAGRPSAP